MKKEWSTPEVSTLEFGQTEALNLLKNARENNISLTTVDDTNSVIYLTNAGLAYNANEKS